MNQRTKEFIIAVQDHLPIFGHTSINAFFDGMKLIEPDFMARDTLVKKLDKKDFAFFINPAGKVYEIYRYKNARYKKQFYIKKKGKTKNN